MDQREIALHCAIETARIQPGQTDVLKDAAAYFGFLTGAGESEPPKAGSSRRSSKGQSTESPKGSVSTETKPTEDTAASASGASSTSSVGDKETDDLFGESEPVKEEKAPKHTIENVKAALVSVQTALKDKKHAIKLLAKHTVPKGTEVLSKLPESNWAALIAEAAASVKSGKVAD